MSPIPDYSRYDLEQLYDVLRHIDRKKFPERLVLIQSEIEGKGGDPHRVQPPVFFVNRNDVTPALRAVRCLVAIEHGVTAAALLFALMNAPLSEVLMGCVSGCTLIFIYAIFCAIGIVGMRATLKDVRELSAVETGWLAATGLAPLSAIIYLNLGAAIIDRLGEKSYISLFLVVPLGFYLPYVLLTYYLKYRYRSDEF